MKVSIFGLGYVGLVTAACLAEQGHTIIGVDTSAAKINLLKKNRMPLLEPQLEELLGNAIITGRFMASADAAAAFNDTDLSLVCVGTPSKNDGGLDYRYIDEICHTLGAVCVKEAAFHTIIFRSTMLPGTMEGRVIPLLEKVSGGIAGRDFGICYNPEFMREGCAVDDFRKPVRFIISATDAVAFDAAEQLYTHLPVTALQPAFKEAEIIKYADNSWHALKVAFANEIGAVCRSEGIDSHVVMDIFCRDTRLNISPHYLKPGFAFGGSCLPKDVRALTRLAEDGGISLPLMQSLLYSNEAHIARGVALVLAQGMKKVGLLGICFKSNTDDVRESPLVEVASRLSAAGLDIKLFDKNIGDLSPSSANRIYLENRLPNLDAVLADTLEETVAHAEVIVIGNNAAEFQLLPAQLKSGQHVIDLVRIQPIEEQHGRYSGICW